MAAMIAITAITTSSSINENALFLLENSLFLQDQFPADVAAVSIGHII